MAISLVDHYDNLVAIYFAFLNMIVIKVRLQKFTTAVLIINWVVNPASKDTFYIIEAEIC